MPRNASHTHPRILLSQLTLIIRLTLIRLTRPIQCTQLTMEALSNGSRFVGFLQSSVPGSVVAQEPKRLRAWECVL